MFISDTMDPTVILLQSIFVIAVALIIHLYSMLSCWKNNSGIAVGVSTCSNTRNTGNKQMAPGCELQRKT